jgi:hypothetical protein
VHRYDYRRLGPGGNHVLEVRERGRKAPQEARELVGHPKRLASRRERDRLDAFRHELGSPCHGREPKLGRERGQLGEKCGDIALVAGALPAKDVRIEEDELGHSASSR